ncbi:hypothetical protein PTTG_30434, partial [Puccinia triticina 1-1 BBBD Race 1]
SGATHDVLSEQFVAKESLSPVPSVTKRRISGFDGSTSHSSSEISLLLNSDSNPSTFIITKLKDLYDGILGMPWIRRHGHLSSDPPTTSQDGEEPGARQARTIDEGVPALCGITPPQCESNTSISTTDWMRTTGKRTLFLEPAPQTSATPHPTQQLRSRADSQAEDSKTTLQEAIATAPAVSSMPTNTSSDREEPAGRSARQIDEGVPAFSGITPPRYLGDISSHTTTAEPIQFSRRRHQDDPTGSHCNRFGGFVYADKHLQRRGGARRE